MNLDTSSLLPPQVNHAKELLDSIYMNGCAADLSDTGCGKTYVALWIAKQLNCPFVVIAPKIARPAWEDVCRDMSITPLAICNYEKLIRGNTPYMKIQSGDVEVPTVTADGKQLTVHQVVKKKRECVYDTFKFQFPLNTFVIVDECHKGRHPKSKTCALIIALKKQGYKVLVMSATAALNPLEMRSFGCVTTLHDVTNFTDFIKSCGANKDNFGGYTIDVQSDETVAAMADIHDRLYHRYSVARRLRKDQFGDLFPENHVIPQCFDMGANTSKIQAVYLEMDRELAKLEESSANYSQHHFAIMMKARRQAEILKLPSVIDMIEDLFDEGISPVVFVNFTDSIVTLENRLLERSKFHGQITKVVGVNGAKGERERKMDIDMFQSNHKRVALVNMQAGNANIGFHDLSGKFPRHSLIFPTWSAVNMIQSMGRIHRAKGRTRTVQKIVFASDTIEEQICRRVKDRVQCLETLNDRDLDLSLRLNF